MNLFLSVLVFFVTLTQVFSIGTYAEGKVVGKLTQFESRGLIFDSYEGMIEISDYNKDEKCDESKDECYIQTKKIINISVRPENADVVNMLNKGLNQEFLFEYNIHRITAIALSSDFEILKVIKQESAQSSINGKDRFQVNKSGGKRNFSVAGKILQLDRQGTFVKTYEGLYIDEVRNKVHSFSVTDEEMAKFVLEAIKQNGKFFFGISVAYVDGFRKSDYDLFEINFKEPAGGSYKTN